jgi:hypothetical protein
VSLGAQQVSEDGGDAVGWQRTLDAEGHRGR